MQMQKLLLETGTVASTLVPFRKGCISSNQSHVSLSQRHSSTKHLVRQFRAIRTLPITISNSPRTDNSLCTWSPAAFSHVPKTTGDSNCYYHATLTGVQKIPGETKIEFDCICFKMHAGKEAGTRFSEVWHLIFAIEKFLCWK